MGARSGNNYLSSLRKLKADLWIDGAHVTDPTIHPAFVHRARAIASLYDLQIEHPGAMTYRLDNGDRAGISFIQPRNANDVRKLSVMFRRWAEYSGGMIRCSPDQVNTSLAAMATAVGFFAASDPRFGENIRNYYQAARRHDWCATYSSPPQLVTENPLRVIETTVAGILVSGSQTLAGLGGLAEELLVFRPPSTRAAPSAQSFVFAINCNVSGLRFLCSTSSSAAAHLADLDCTATFTDVTIPWERVFLCGDIACRDTLADATGTAIHLLHQAAVRDTVAAEFRLGRAAVIARARDAFAAPGVRERIAQMMFATGVMRDLLRVAEAAAHPDQWDGLVPARQPLDAVEALSARAFPVV